MKKIKVSIAGAAGYTGGELLRLLMLHPAVSIVCAHSNSQAGKHIGMVHQDLTGDTDLHFSSSLSTDVDVIFLCMNHGDSSLLLPTLHINAHAKIIDLSQDFRIAPHNHSDNLSFVYGLPEFNRDNICSSRAVANPGCFATAIQLALLPLAKANALHEVFATGITGSTGAGQTLSESSHFSWRANNIQPYKTLQHQHLGEINATLNQLQPTLKNNSIHFTPWRGNFTRGIFATLQTRNESPLGLLYEWYESFYSRAAFTRVSQSPIHLKQVVNTNKALIHLEKQNDILVVHVAIDNLLKGAVGQAVQNMNLMLGLNETTGLELKAAYF